MLRAAAVVAALGILSTASAAPRPRVTPSPRYTISELREVRNLVRTQLGLDAIQTHTKTVVVDQERYSRQVKTLNRNPQQLPFGSWRKQAVQVARLLRKLDRGQLATLSDLLKGGASVSISNDRGFQLVGARGAATMDLATNQLKVSKPTGDGVTVLGQRVAVGNGAVIINSSIDGDLRVSQTSRTVRTGSIQIGDITGSANIVIGSGNQVSVRR